MITKDSKNKKYRVEISRTGINFGWSAAAYGFRKRRPCWVSQTYPAEMHAREAADSWIAKQTTTKE